ncbi:MAG TPA: class I SAM-dependent methyltransferase, partial [Ktedonobacteraceae bacterium]|nr:class I SAM-dependent methyltransferase [Ktedonobacteraceae bacterium]
HHGMIYAAVANLGHVLLLCSSGLSIPMVTIRCANRAHYQQLYRTEDSQAEPFEVVSKSTIATSALRDVGVHAGRSVLDVGFGSGHLLRQWTDIFSHRYGVEPVFEAAQGVRMRDPSIHAVVAEAEYLPFREEMFDVVSCSHVLEHLGDDTQAILEMRRVLRRDGLLIVGVPGEGYRDDDPLHYRKYCFRSLQDLALRAKLSIKLIRAYGSPLFAMCYTILGRVARLLEPKSMMLANGIDHLTITTIDDVAPPRVIMQRGPRLPGLLNRLARIIYRRWITPILVSVYIVDARLARYSIRQPIERWLVMEKTS